MYSIKQKTIVWRTPIHYEALGEIFAPARDSILTEPREMTVGRGEDREVMADLFLRLTKTCMEDEMLELWDPDWELLASYSPNGAFTE